MVDGREVGKSGNGVKALPGGGLPLVVDARLWRVKQHVTSDLRRSVSRDEAAALLKMKPSTFTRWFTRCAGKTYSRWVRETRIAAAAELLSHSGAELDDVAYRVGYNDLSTFRRNFKRMKGMTAGKFRRRAAESRLADARRPTNQE